MATGNWRTGADIEALLLEQPEQFDFYQAVRLLESIAAQRSPGDPSKMKLDDVVRFAAKVSQEFPTSDIEGLEYSEEGNAPAKMMVNFMGLAGAHGPLPSPITQRILMGNRTSNEAAAAFLDIFNNRLISLFYKTQAQHSANLARVLPNQHPVGQGVLSLIGLGEGASRDRLLIPDLALMRFSGLLASRPISKMGLEKLISNLFDIPTKVTSFVGRWLRIDNSQKTRIGKDGKNNRLGVDTIIGERAWEQAGGIEIELGPLSKTDFPDFLMGGKRFDPLADLIEFSVEKNLTIRLRLIIARDARPQARLQRSNPMRLGWSSWLLPTEESSLDRQVTLSLRA
ncbi:MAG: type VI secretion system baseplate subunit TssG [Alphaproteobacteria bacterium]|nr:type VI secretion system baseplate subunit TssG [Alphaproteobacteria bacterium]